MSLRILCPNLKCRSILTVPQDTRGKKVRCGHCSAILVVPVGQTTKSQARPEPIGAEAGAPEAS